MAHIARARRQKHEGVRSQQRCQSAGSIRPGALCAIVGVSGYADTRPMDRTVIDRQTPAEAERNRRIEVRIIMSTNEELVGAVLNELNQRLRSVDELVR